MKISINELKTTVKEEVKNYLTEAGDVDDPTLDIDAKVNAMFAKPSDKESDAASMKALQQAKLSRRKEKLSAEQQEKNIENFIQTYGIKSAEDFQRFLQKTDKRLETLANELGTGISTLSRAKTLIGGERFLDKVQQVIDKKSPQKDVDLFDTIKNTAAENLALWKSAIRKTIEGMINVGQASREKRTGLRRNKAFTESDIENMSKDKNIITLIQYVYVTQLARAHAAQQLMASLVMAYEQAAEHMIDADARDNQSLYDRYFREFKWLKTQINKMIEIMQEQGFFGDQQRWILSDIQIGTLKNIKNIADDDDLDAQDAEQPDEDEDEFVTPDIEPSDKDLKDIEDLKDND